MKAASAGIAGEQRKAAEPASRMRVCIIAEASGFGGTEVHTLALMEAILARGHQVVLIGVNGDVYMKHASQLAVSDDVVLMKGPRSATTNDRDLLSHWWTILSGVRADLLIIPRGWWGHYSPAFLKLCRRAFRRIYLIEHLDPPTLYRSRLLRKLGIQQLFGVHVGFGFRRYRQMIDRMRVILQIDKVIAVSQSVRNQMVRDWWIPPSRIAVVRNGVRWQKFSRDPGARDIARGMLGLPRTTFVFGMLVRLAHIKGIDIALRAVRHVLDSGDVRDFCVVIAGSGPDEASLRQLASELKVADHVRFLGHRDDVRSILPAFDSIMFSSRKEGLPLGLLEGMASGCVPIVTDISGMPEVIAAAGTGWIVERESPARLASAMIEALRMNDDELRAASERAVSAVREHFDLEACHRRILEIMGIPDTPAQGATASP